MDGWLAMKLFARQPWNVDGEEAFVAYVDLEGETSTPKDGLVLYVL